MGSLQPFYEKNLLSEVYADISEIAGGNRPGRENEDERIIYVPMGMGSEDIAVGQHVYTRALAMGRGSRFTLCRGL
jgi:ornithine cyclodeaminase/alanine dehydrogenase-like protein (mu-crystallin family)